MKKGVILFLLLILLNSSLILAKEINIPDTSSRLLEENYYSILESNIVAKVNNDVEYLHRDRLGSNIATTGNDLKRNKNLPFGQEISNDGITYSFTGKELDDNDLYYFVNRYYNPDSGRFLETDSVYSNPSYVYANNNPLLYVDPDGRRPEDIGKIILSKRKDPVSIQENAFEWVLRTEDDIHLSTLSGELGYLGDEKILMVRNVDTHVKYRGRGFHTLLTGSIAKKEKIDVLFYLRSNFGGTNADELYNHGLESVPSYKANIKLGFTEVEKIGQGLLFRKPAVKKALKSNAVGTIGGLALVFLFSDNNAARAEGMADFLIGTPLMGENNFGSEDTSLAELRQEVISGERSLTNLEGYEDLNQNVENSIISQGGILRDK